MSSGTLFVSFWDICLDNLPEGAFVRQNITAVDAKQMIDEARQQAKLLCVSDTDLFAPYKARERNKHAELCTVLNETFGIQLKPNDFTGKHDDDDGPRYAVNPLVVAQVRGQSRMLVVTCAYTMSEKREDGCPLFEVSPSSVEFSLFEATDSPDRG